MTAASFTHYLASLGCVLLGLLYPALQTYKAASVRDFELHKQWLTYWIIFSLLWVVEFFFAPWIPMFYEIKFLFLLYLLLPQTKGATQLFDKTIHPTLLHNEAEIDRTMDTLKSNIGNHITTKSMQARQFLTLAMVKFFDFSRQQLAQNLAQQQQPLPSAPPQPATAAASAASGSAANNKSSNPIIEDITDELGDYSHE